MPTLTVNLAKTYALNLSQYKVEPVDRQNMLGKNKLRRFFVHAKWEDYIASVNVSSAGAKGGVFFLEAYVGDSATFVQQLNALNVNINPDSILRRLHSQHYLANGVVKLQVMQPGFSLTDTFYGRTAAARNNVLTALLNAVQLRKRYVVKGTNEPGRTLFAEYVLNTIGKAKIPKSLVLEVDPSRPHTHVDPSEGMTMLNLINTRPNPGVDAARYNAAYANLHNGAQPVVDYLVVQKLLAGDPIESNMELYGRVVKFLCDQKIIINVHSFLSDQNFVGDPSATIGLLVQELNNGGCLKDGLVDPNFQAQLNNVQTLNNKKNQIQAVLAAAQPTLVNNQLQRQDYENKSSAAQFDQLVHDLQNKNTALKQALDQFLATIRPIIATHERILTNADMMENTGRVHFADALLANGDRFNNFNTGNFFYIRRQATPGSNKATNPIGCIDNDSFLYTYLPAHSPAGFRNALAYVNKLLSPTFELWGWNDPQPPGMVFAPNLGVIDALEFNRWFEITFFQGFIEKDVPKTVLEMYNANLFAPGDVTPFTNTIALPGWGQVSSNLREGIYRALLDYQNTASTEFAGVYQKLTELYYPGPNFEFTAFAIRDRYLRKCIVDPQTWSIQLPALAVKKKIQSETVEWLKTVGHVNPDCDAPQLAPIADRALVFGGQNQLVNPADDLNIRNLLLTLDMSDQERLLPNPFDSGPLWKFSSSDRATLEKKWGSLKSKYRNRMNVVICTLLHKFWNEYIAEVGYLTNDRARVRRSDAFGAAVALCQQVSNLRLCKDVNTTLQARQQVLGNGLNLVGHITAQ